MTPDSQSAKSAYRRYSRRPLIAICFLCTALVAVTQAIFQPLRNAEFSAEDLLLRLGRPAPANPELVFLAIDQASCKLDQIGLAEIEASPGLRLMSQGFPWPRTVYPLILDRLFEAGAKVVVIDLLFVSPRDDDGAFRAALDKYRDRVVIGSNFDSGERDNGGIQKHIRTHVVPSASLIAPKVRLDDRIAFVNFWPDLDGVVRRAHYGVTISEVFGDTPQPGEEIIGSLAARALEKSGHGDLVPKGTAPRRIRFAGLPGTFAAHSACDIFDLKQWSRPDYRNGEFFRGKIVLLGPEGELFHDVVRTPVGSIAGPELHLHAMNAALQREFLRETSLITNYLLIAGAGALAWALCHWFRGPLFRLGSLVLAAAAWLAAAMALYNYAGLFILTVAPLIALTSSGVGCLGWDFFLERRERARVRSVLDKYVAKNVAELVLAEGDAFAGAIQGQRRTVTILFSDIRGFTTMSEESVPEEFIAQMNEYFYAMVEVVLAEGGTLQNYIGDAILAVWGDTRSMEPKTGAYQTVRTALLQGVALRKLNEGWAGRADRWQLNIGIGVNQGEVIVGSVGHPLRMSFTVMGDTVNTAARLESATKQFGCGILVSESVEALTRDRFHYRRVDLIRLKGKTKPDAIFTVLGETSTPPPPWLGEYHRAVDLYHAREFRTAGEIFRKLGEELRDDVLCAMYSERCNGYMDAPPPGDWDGSYTMTKK
ncbi:MAG: adenylate/guanylate cyclase domain-containing protein [Chthoniobacteraceae bacterium]